jgi:protein involved in polysaccharide export with SLBB domain
MRRVFRSLLTVLAVPLFFASTGQAQRPDAGGAASVTNSGSPALMPSSSPNHLLGPQDIIEVKVYQEQDLDTTARVSDDGKINFPLIGDVVVNGKTEQQAARLIRDRLQARFLVDPQVTVTVVQQNKRLFTVLGQVQHPGTYRFPERESLNLIQVIGIAGGYTRLADTGRITVKRNEQGRDVVFRLDANRMARDQATKAFVVVPGDLITVGERAFF